MPTRISVILSAAGTLKQPFTTEDLVVAAFKLNPMMFRLGEFEKYPDNNKVLCCLMGKDGLVRKKLLEKVATGVYKLPIRSTMEA